MQLKVKDSAPTPQQRSDGSTPDNKPTSPSVGGPTPRLTGLGSFSRTESEVDHLKGRKHLTFHADSSSDNPIVPAVSDVTEQASIHAATKPPSVWGSRRREEEAPPTTRNVSFSITRLTNPSETCCFIHPNQESGHGSGGARLKQSFNQTSCCTFTSSRKRESDQVIKIRGFKNCFNLHESEF